MLNQSRRKVNRVSSDVGQTSRSGEIPLGLDDFLWSSLLSIIWACNAGLHTDEVFSRSEQY